MAATNIFSAQAGKIVALEGDAVPIAFSVDGDPYVFNDLKAIVTSIGIQGQGGFQFMHALREFIYVYVFTERIGEIVISGLAFPASCKPLGSQDAPNAYASGGCEEGDENCAPCQIIAETGFERIMRWYECNRITTRAAPISIAIGTDVAYDAFLVSVKADIVNPETGIAQFSMRFNYVPDISDADDFCFPISTDQLESPCEDVSSLSFNEMEDGDD